MTSNNDTPAKQFNIASEQRNAARDYFEYAGVGSLDVVLATWTPKELDDTAKFNPNLFKLRYGFSASTPARADVIAFQQEYDLLDKDICWLKRAGHIQVKRKGIKVDTSALMPILGSIQLLFFSLIVGLMFLQVGKSSAPDWKQVLGFSGVGIFWFAVIFVLCKFYITPWHTLRACGAIEGERRKKGEAHSQTCRN